MSEESETNGPQDPADTAGTSTPSQWRRRQPNRRAAGRNRNQTTIRDATCVTACPRKPGRTAASSQTAGRTSKANPNTKPVSPEPDPYLSIRRTHPKPATVADTSQRRTARAKPFSNAPTAGIQATRTRTRQPHREVEAIAVASDAPPASARSIGEPHVPFDGTASAARHEGRTPAHHHIRHVQVPDCHARRLGLRHPDHRSANATGRPILHETHPRIRHAPHPEPQETPPPSEEPHEHDTGTRDAAKNTKPHGRTTDAQADTENQSTRRLPCPTRDNTHTHTHRNEPQDPRHGDATNNPERKTERDERTHRHANRRQTNAKQKVNNHINEVYSRTKEVTSIRNQKSHKKQATKNKTPKTMNAGTWTEPSTFR